MLGRDGAEASITGTKSSANISDANGAVFTFQDSDGNEVLCQRVRIEATENLATPLYIKWNDDEADDADSAWDQLCYAGGVAVSEPRDAVAKVAIYATAEATYGTDYVVKGWV